MLNWGCHCSINLPVFCTIAKFLNLASAAPAYWMWCVLLQPAEIGFPDLKSNRWNCRCRAGDPRKSWEMTDYSVWGAYGIYRTGLTHLEDPSQAIIGRPFTVTSFTDAFMVIFTSHIHHSVLSTSLSAVLHIQFASAVQSTMPPTRSFTLGAWALQHPCAGLLLQNYTIIAD